MSGNAPRAPFEAFFLPAAGGERFCIFHPASGAPLGSILYVHPFAEEMNKSRRMAALQARAFCARGYNAFQIDLLGCGDSSGDFGDARWNAWHEDVVLATDWLAKHTEGPVHLWGLRLGALLALDHSRQAGRSFAGLLLWQPVISGAQFMTQFLRLRMGSEMLSGAAPGSGGTEQLRAQLAAGRALEISGYELAPQLASAIERLDLAALPPKYAPAHWFEVNAEGKPSPGLRRAAQACIAAGAEVELHAVRGEPFWSSVELCECPELVAATSDTLTLTHA
jgi:exosortase A-associated hydrolase 2